MKAIKKVTKTDFDKAVEEFCKFGNEIIAGSDEKRKLQLLEGLQNLMNPNFAVTRPIEVADIVSEAKLMKLTATKVPNEIWMKIMSYLKTKAIFSNFALVNKHFHELSLDPSAVKYLHLEDIKNESNSKAFYAKWLKVIKRSKTLIELKIKDQNKILDWNKLIITALKSNPGLKSLKIDYNDNLNKGLLTLSPGVTETLKLAINLQCFEAKFVILSQDLLDEICKMKSLKSIFVPYSNGSINPEFVTKMAFSQNPIESFYAHIYGNKKSISDAIKTLYTEKKNTMKTLDTFELRDQFGSDQIDHKKCTPLPNYNLCKNIRHIFETLHDHDLALISDLPNLEKLSIKQIINDVGYLKAFHHMNLSNLKYLFLQVKTKTDYDDFFEELSNVPFPSLKRLFVRNEFQAFKEDVVPVIEYTLQRLIKNVPTLTSIILKAHSNFATKISHQFMFKMLKDEDVIIITDNTVTYRTTDKSQRKVEKFFEKKGSAIHSKWISMATEYSEQCWLQYHDKYPY